MPVQSSKIWPDFGQLQSTGANIFVADGDIQNQTNIWSTVIPSVLGETSLVKFGPVALEISMWGQKLA